MMTTKTDVCFVDEDGIIKNLDRAIALGHNIGLRGKTGTGKTTLIQEMARVAGKKLYILNMTATSGVDELKGRTIVKPSSTVMAKTIVEWIYGQLARAMQEGAWLCIEEANFMNEEMASVLYSVMDFRRSLTIDEHENEVIKAHPDFRLFFTMNWDYRGTVRPNDAIMNRINSWFDIPYLSKKEEAKLIRNRTGIDGEIADKMADFACKIRGMSDKENLPDLSTRILINWAEMVKAGATPIEASEFSVIPILGYTKNEKDLIRGLITALFVKRKKDDDDV